MFCLEITLKKIIVGHAFVNIIIKTIKTSKIIHRSLFYVFLRVNMVVCSVYACCSWCIYGIIYVSSIEKRSSFHPPHYIIVLLFKIV